MISKISAVNSNFKAQSVQKSATKTNVQADATKSVSLSGAEFSSMYQAMNGIQTAKTVSFGALTDLEKSIIGSKEIRIPNLLDLNENIDLPLKNMPEKTEHLNSAGLNVVKKSQNGTDIYTISNDKGNVIFLGKIDASKPKEELPVLVYKQGKFMPEITVKDPALNGKSVKMLSGSHIKGDGFELLMPGSYEPKPGEGSKKVSFKGRTVITTLNKEPRTLNAVESYMNSSLPKETVKGDYYDEVKAADPTVIIPAGGFGERFFNITREYENKPSGKLPTHDEYRIMATAMNLAAGAGIINADETDEVKYLSQAHEIPEGGDVRYVSKYKTDGGAIAEGLSRDIIDNNKPAVILNADIFSNADITRTFHALQTLPNAALVIPYYPVNPERAKSFGLLGVKQDEAGHLQIKEFLEKPKYTSDAPLPNDFRAPGEYDKAMAEFKKAQTAQNPADENSYLANPGFYFLSPQALKVLTAKGILEPNATGLGAHVMPEIVKLANEGKLLDSEGNQMKVYTVPLETKGGKPAVWDDIGTAEAYLKLIKEVANEYNKNGNTPENKYYGVPEFLMSDFAKNTDLTTGIVYDSEKARTSFEEFKTKHNVTVAEGNIFVASPN
ncbi:MAG: hypothetical protein IJY61_00155 [Candidatus Gastranaerophilales bacterium]|nr:hypothetical protein [Candidatus Gastranaerophilales bacterium]